MTNIGYNDTTFGWMFLCLLILPIVLAFASTFIGYVIYLLYFVVIGFQQMKKPLYVDRYVDRPVTVTKTVYRDRPRSKTPEKPQAAQKKSPQTDSKIIEEAISGLANLGLKKKQAKTMVDSLSSKEYYSSTEDLLSDCFSQL
tara:strand:+ start:319 stop:744 length:426 start_codon:yes stop_codon:yes gene_type:complete